MWKEISLSGNDWIVAHALPSEANPTTQTIKGITGGDLNGPDWIKANVPGDVQSDAIEAGIIPDINFGLNSRAAEWTYQRDWIYYRTFEIEKPKLPLDSIVLEFEGVDYSCDVFLNGAWLGHHEVSWTSFEFDITEKVRHDKPNDLIVVVEHAPDEQCQWGRTSRVSTLKARFAYGWDWCTRLVPIGIWKDVRLVARGPAFLKDLWAKPYINSDMKQASIDLEITIQSNCMLNIQLDIILTYEENVIYSFACLEKLESGKNLTVKKLNVENPRLWYPNGYGEQPIYKVEARIIDENGFELDKRATNIGFRKIEWFRTESAQKNALPYCLKMNGRLIFIKGWNWAPIRQLYGRIHPEVYDRRIELAKKAGCNFLRVCGVGLCEREIFYDLCDRRGIMIMQELFLSSCCIDNHPSIDDKFIQLVVSTASPVIREKRNHPSLVVWSGGNELSVRGNVMDRHGNILRPDAAGKEGYITETAGLLWEPLESDYPVLRALYKCVKEADPDKLWLPVCPSGPVVNASVSQVGNMHDVHGPWVNLGPTEQYHFYNTVDMMLHSEFGCDGSASQQSIERFLPEGKQWPIDSSNEMAWHHGRMWSKDNLKRTEEFFGKIDDLETYIRASQFVQAEGLRYAIEAHRRRKWKCSGAIMWHMSEPWPNVCDTCSIDYYNQPKPAYYAVARAFSSVHVSARYETIEWGGKPGFSSDIWCHNSTSNSVNAKVLIDVWSVEGICIYKDSVQVHIPSENSVQCHSVHIPATDLPERAFMLQCILKSSEDKEFSRHWSLHSPESSKPLEALRFLEKGSIQFEKESKRIFVKNTGMNIIIALWLETKLTEQVFISDNWICLVPGEIKQFNIEGKWTELRLSAWNINQILIKNI